MEELGWGELVRSLRAGKTEPEEEGEVARGRGGAGGKGGVTKGRRAGSHQGRGGAPAWSSRPAWGLTVSLSPSEAGRAL